MPSSRRLYPWYVVAVLTLANVCGFVDRQILSLLVVPIERDLGISDTQMSYLIGLSFSVFYTVLGIPIARWADRYSRRAIMALGITLWSVATALCGLADGFGRLFAARVGVGVGEATLVAPSVSLLADYFPRERLGTATSVYSLGIFLGSGLAYFVGGWMVGLTGQGAAWHWPVVGAVRPWQSVFFAIGAPGLLVALLMLTVREPRRTGGGSRAAGGDGVPGTGAAARGPRPALLAYVRANARTFATQSLGFGASAAVNYGIAAWLATFLVRTYGWTPTRAGLVQGVLTMTVGVGGTLAGGWGADRYARAGRLDGPLRVGIIGALGMLLAASVYPLMPTATLAVAWLVAVNFFAAFPWGAASAAAAEVAPAPLRTQGAALYFFVVNLVSAALGPTAVAVVTDRVFRDAAALRYSLVLVDVVGMTIAIALLAAGLPAYRRTIAERARWE